MYIVIQIAYLCSEIFVFFFLHTTQSECLILAVRNVNICQEKNRASLLYLAQAVAVWSVQAAVGLVGLTRFFSGNVWNDFTRAGMRAWEEYI